MPYETKTTKLKRKSKPPDNVIACFNVLKLYVCTVHTVAAVGIINDYNYELNNME